MKPSSTDTQDIERDIEAGQEQAGASQEQAADLAALQAAVSEEQAAAQAASQPAQREPAGPSEGAVQVAALAVQMLRPVVVYAVPSLRGAPDELWHPLPEGIAGILDHYGIDASALNSPWAKLAMACAPLVAYGAMQAMQQAKKKPDQPAQAIEQTTSQPADQPAQVWGQGVPIPA